MRFHGKVGYGSTVETSPGVWEDVIEEHNHFGDVVRVSRAMSQGEDLNQDLTPGVAISLVEDTYASENIFNARYLEWMGKLWNVSSVEADPERPRLTLRLGGVYNGPTPTVAESP